MFVSSAGHGGAGSHFGVKAANRADNDFDVLLCRFAAHGQRQNFAAERLCVAEARIGKAQSGVAPHRLDPMDKRFDAVGRQVLFERIAMFGSNDVVLKDIALM